jgi:tetratricopeptide (TPR) repeat protein
MLAGYPPFTGSDIQTVMRQHLAAEAPKVTGARSLVPAGVAKTIHRAMAKTPADRFRTVAEFEKALAGATLPLLARIPMGRARAAFFAAAWVLLLAAVAFLARRVPGGAPELSDDLVVVLPFENRTGDSEYDAAAEQLARDIATRLYQAQVIEFVSPELVAASWRAARERQARDPSYLVRRAVAEDQGAAIVVDGYLTLRGNSLTISSEISRNGGLHSIHLMDPVEEPATEAGLAEAVREMTERVVAAIAWYHEVRWSDSTTTSPPKSLAIKEVFDDAWNGWSYGNRDLKGARDGFLRTLEMDPTFNIAKVLLADAYLGLGDRRAADSLLDETEALKDVWPPFDRLSWEATRARVDEDWDAVYEVLREASRRTPTPLFVLGFARQALARNRPREAWEAMRHLDPTSIDMTIAEHWRSLGDNIARALHMLGDHERELEEVLRFRELHPDNEGFFLNEIKARAALGQGRQVAELVEEAIERGWSPLLVAQRAGEELRAHGQPEAARRVYERGFEHLETLPEEGRETWSFLEHRFFLLGGLERFEEASAVAEELVGRNPNNWVFLAFKAGTAAQLGRREEALSIEARLAAMGPNTTYLRACIVAALGDRPRAMDLLVQAHEEGRSFSPLLHSDPSFEPLWDYPPFQRFLEPKG